MEDEKIIEIERLQSTSLLSRGTFHQLGNLLTLISGYSSLVRMNVDPGSEDAELMGKIDKAVKQMSSLMDDTHRFVRGKKTERKPLDLKKISVDVADLLGRTFPRLIVRVEGSDEPVVANVSQRDIFDALIHLSMNSSEAMDGQGRLTLEVERLAGPEAEALRSVEQTIPEGEICCITLTDEGPGFDAIPIKRKQEVRECFKTGLGLAAVRAIISAHGGSVIVGRGSRNGGSVKLVLPSS